MSKKPVPSLFTLTMLVLFSSATPVLAADQASAVSRARSHITDFPGRSLHGRDHSYEVRDVIMDADGAEHVRFDRRYKGLPVIGGDMVVHSSRTGTFVNTSLTLNRQIDMPIRPSLNAGRALEAAQASHPGEARGTAPSLVVYARGDLPALAWDVRVYGEQADGTPSEKHVIVDAHSGLVLDAWDDIHTGASGGTGNGFFNGAVNLTTNSITGGYELRDPTRGGQYTIDMKNKQGGSGSVLTDTDNTWGNFLLTDRATVGVDAQYGTAMTWDYYKNVHGDRKSVV